VKLSAIHVYKTLTEFNQKILLMIPIFIRTQVLFTVDEKIQPFKWKIQIVD
jgi:hypothetical protein